jgi:hypothetical protein
VISRLCSSHHNPDGYRFLMFGLIGLATFLAPLPAWIAYNIGGSPFLRTRGRRTYWVGLLATASIAVERGLFPTHWTRLEMIHLMLAAVAFGFLWLGLAILAGAPDVPRVRWRWLWRPPWFLAACVLPLCVVAGLYFPFRIIPGALVRALPAWPRPLKLLRAEAFWQWYLVTGLLFSSAALACRVSRLKKHGRASVGAWRVDAAQRAVPHRGAGKGLGRPAAGDAVGEFGRSSSASVSASQGPPTGPDSGNPTAHEDSPTVSTDEKNKNNHRSIDSHSGDFDGAIAVV